MNYFTSARFSLQMNPQLRAYDGDVDVGARVDGIFWMRPIHTDGNTQIVWFIGPGLHFLYYATRAGVLSLGLEATIGIAWQFHSVPLDLMVELVPILDFYANKTFDFAPNLGAGVTVRYYF